MKRMQILITGLLAAFVLLPSVFAAGADVPVDHTRLVRLYELQLQGSGDPSLPRRIENERVRVRGDIDDQVNDLINALSRSGTGDNLNLAGSITQQRAVVTALQTRQEGTDADLELLDREKQYYDGTVSAGSGALDPGRVTTSEADLLARRAVFEEQEKSLNFFLSLESDRLGKLEWQQRLQQFSLLITISRYVLLFLLVIVAERIIRLQFLTRIHKQNARYIISKLFTGAVYTITLLWIVAQISADYPGILTSLAILGAGVAIALQDIFKDIVGWVVIVQKRLFTLGHRVTIGAYTGDVVDISLLSTTLLEVSNTTAPDASRAGQVLAIPNAAVLTQPVLNYSATSDYVDAELTLLFTYDSDLVILEEKLRAILNEETQQYIERARRQTSGRMKQFYTSHEPQGSRVYFEPLPSGIRASLKFPVPIGERRIVVTRLLKRILTEVSALDAKIRIAAEPHEAFEL